MCMPCMYVYVSIIVEGAGTWVRHMGAECRVQTHLAHESLCESERCESERCESERCESEVWCESVFFIEVL